MNRSAARPTPRFRNQFERKAFQLALHSQLSENELALLCEAAFYSRLCHIAFNGLGGCAGKIKPNQELNRIALERAFMKAYQAFWSCPGAKRLSDDQKISIRRAFLTVSVSEKNLARAFA
jgi:hypothetical protein